MRGNFRRISSRASVGWGVFTAARRGRRCISSPAWLRGPTGGRGPAASARIRPTTGVCSSCSRRPRTKTPHAVCFPSTKPTRRPGRRSSLVSRWCLTPCRTARHLAHTCVQRHGGDAAHHPAIHPAEQSTVPAVGLDSARHTRVADVLGKRPVECDQRPVPAASGHGRFPESW